MTAYDRYLTRYDDQQEHNENCRDDDCDGSCMQPVDLVEDYDRFKDFELDQAE